MAALADAHFVTGATAIAGLPADCGYEVAFTGRSNAGKSTALNRLTGHVGLARVSKTPGRTQQINVFAIDAGRRLIDLPGYGYAKVPPPVRRRLAALTRRYIAERQCLRALVLLADIRHGLKTEDHALLATRPDLPALILLSKADKLSRQTRAARVLAVTAAVGSHGLVLSFSALDGQGVDDARAWVEGFLAD